MIKSDNHVHTAFSTDSNTPMEEMLKKAIEIGFSSICFTDHMDYDFPSKDKNGKAEFLLDTPAYFDEMARLALLYPQIRIRRGIELGLKENVIDNCISLASEYKFDFIIASTHLVCNTDPYSDAYWQNTDEKSAILKYYEATLENAKSGADFDVYGHIDYITRYTPYMKKLRKDNLYDNAYSLKTAENFLDIIEEIFKILIYNGKGIEINTGGLKYGTNHTNPHERILKLYSELGGEIITVGSDAHETRHLGYDFYRVPEILQLCGFKYYTEFTGRKPSMIKCLS